MNVQAYPLPDPPCDILLFELAYVSEADVLTRDEREDWAYERSKIAAANLLSDLVDAELL
jgi:hypothetical protein